ncbi:MAG: serine/threonine-protein kinase [Polyangiaceae bacterium]
MVTGEPFDTAKTQAQLTAAWDVRGIDLGGVTFDDKGTIHDHQRLVDRLRPMVTLPSLLAPGPAGSKPQLELGDILGEGGMGVVRVALQTSLDREVAVKGLKENVTAGHAAPQLLREGRVTGVLEHPNVVPVYALGRDNLDRPLLVMKRISGRTWGSMLRAEGVDRMSDGHLREHLGILKQVAHAVGYAHAKGIVHRDLKPDNVMIGDFGEVYVVDWGIAVSTRRGAVPGVPSAQEVAAIEGTPAYMAPEMAAGDGELIDAHSDIYLLGAILHEIITGEPPHDGATLMLILTEAFASVPKEYPPSVPPELVQIVHRAMAREPEDRYATAAELAAGLDEFLEHRSSAALTRAAEQRRVELARLCEELTEPASPSPEQAEAIQASFSECRFAYRLALKGWPDNPDAKAGLEACLGLMIDYELGRGAPLVAASLLREHGSPPPALSAKVAREAERFRQRQERLAAIARDADLSIGQQLRRSVSLMLSLLYATICFGYGYLTRSGLRAENHYEFAALNLLLAVVIVVSVVLRKETLFSTAVNRRQVTFATVLFMAHGGVWILGGVTGVSAITTAVFHTASSVTLWLLGTVTLERRWWPICVGSAIALGFLFLFPTYLFEWVGGFGVAGSLVATLLLMRDGPPVSTGGPASSRRPASF